MEKCEEKHLNSNIEKIINVYKDGYPMYRNMMEDCQILPLDLLDTQFVKQWRINCRLVPLLGQSIPPQCDAFPKLEIKKLLRWKLKLVNFSDLRPENTYSHNFPSFMEPILLAVTKCFKKFSKVKEFSVHLKEMNLVLQINFKNQVIAALLANDNVSDLGKILRNYLSSIPLDSWNLTSFYFQTPKSNLELLYGVDELEEKFEGAQFRVTADSMISTDFNRVTTIIRAVNNFLEPSLITTFLEIGCGNQLISLSLAHKFNFVIGIDDAEFIREAENLRSSNEIRNASFVDNKLNNLTDLLEVFKSCRRIVAVVNQATDIGRSFLAMECLQKLKFLERLIIVTPLTDQCFESFLKLATFAQSDSSMFKLTHFCVTEDIAQHVQLHVSLFSKCKKSTFLPKNQSAKS